MALTSAGSLRLHLKQAALFCCYTLRELFCRETEILQVGPLRHCLVRLYAWPVTKLFFQTLGISLATTGMPLGWS